MMNQLSLLFNPHSSSTHTTQVGQRIVSFQRLPHVFPNVVDLKVTESKRFVYIQNGGCGLSLV
jgi:hypothetical protein